nr:ribonuclease H-like domain-containing protein [Tanacetum cinerariifolium]
MVTRAKAGIFKSLERMNCHVTTTSPLPRSHVHALRDPHLKEAMLDKYNALIGNETWVLVPRPANVNVVRSMWLFKHKFKADGSLSSLVVKPATIHTVLSLAVFRDWPIHQLDVKNAFLHGHLSKTVYMYQPTGFVNPNKPGYVCHLQWSSYGLKQASRAWFQRFASYATRTVYMHQPPGFVDHNKPGYVCHLQRFLYGLKQASRAWFQHFASYATRVGFQHSKTGSFLFVFHRGSDSAYLLLYVDDIILTASSSAFLQRIIASLHSEFAMTDLSSHNYFLGIFAQRSTSGLFLSQSIFTEEILDRLSWSAKCQVTLSRSSAEAGYRGVANVVAETAWIRNLLCELHTPLFTATLVYCDNWCGNKDEEMTMMVVIGDQEQWWRRGDRVAVGL